MRTEFCPLSTRAEVVEMEALRLNAKRMQTPRKRASWSSLSSFKDANAYDELLEGEQWEDVLKVYEKVWKKLAFDKNLDLPPSSKVQQKLRRL